MKSSRSAKPSFASRDDPARIEDARQELYRVYRKRQGILDAIAVL